MGKKIAIFLITTLIILGGVYFGLKYFNQSPEIIEYKQLDDIKGYNYTLHENDTELFKTRFNALEDILTKEEIDYEGYAKELSSLFIIDLYTINNKINKYDVGGVDFVYDTIKDNYMTNVEDTIYRYVTDNATGKRNQELPEVSEVNVSNVEKTTYKIDSEKKEYEAYKVSLDWKYVTDMGYDTKGDVILIKVDNTLYVVEKD